MILWEHSSFFLPILRRFVTDIDTSAGVDGYIRHGHGRGIRDKQGTDAVVVDGQFLDPFAVDFLGLVNINVDYERSSWRYMDYDQKAMPHEDLDCYKIGGANHTFCDTMDAYMIGKGGGSAYGGKWRPNPNKPQDQRYLGNPGEIKRTIMNNGDVYKTKMGPDGRAEMERHETNHNRGDKHTNPHDHRISWDNPDEHPVPGPPINYPNGAPEFKNFSEVFCMKEIIVPYGSMNFETISEFKRSINWGAEIEFEWNGAVFNIIRYGTDGKITIYAANKPETEKVCETADEALEYMVGDDRLRDIITKVHVVSRSI